MRRSEIVENSDNETHYFVLQALNRPNSDNETHYHTEQEGR